MRTRRPAVAVAALLTLSITLMGCTEASDNPERPSGNKSPSAEPTTLTLGVHGSAAVLEAWETVVSDYNSGNVDAQVTLVPWRTAAEVTEVVDAAEDADDADLPDVYMASRHDVSTIMEKGLNRPVAELLDERGVDFGDRYSRDAVEAFSRDNDLQCMGYAISPTVMYVNQRLVNFEAMRQRGLDVPHRWDRWSLNEFAEAARFGLRPARGGAGLHVEPTVEGLAPFLLSGGGTLVDDPADPTSLNFSSGESREALEKALAVLRDATLTLTDKQLAKRPALEWFKRGKVAMIAGQRDLVPELRTVEKLNFDVMPMPYAGTAATVGDAHGLCISQGTTAPGAAADLIAYLVGDEASAEVARVGATVPANLAVAGSQDFLQEDQMPKTSKVFNSAVRGMTFPPPGFTWEELQKSVAPFMRQLLLDPGEIDLDAITTQIDEASSTVLSPAPVTPSPSATATP